MADKNASRKRLKTPERMVVDGKIAEFGVFTEPFREVNLLDYDLEVRGKRVSRTIRNLRLKEWQHFGIVHDKYYFGMVIFDAKFMGVSFFYAYDRETGEFFEHNRTKVGGSIKVARELWHGECYFQFFGYRMEFENRLDSGLHRLMVDVKETRKKPAVLADIRVLEDLDRVEPLVLVSPLAPDRVQYTHKVACPVEGTVRLGEKTVELDPAKTIALIDVQKSYFFNSTVWKWATFGGFDGKGRLVAMNACEGLVADDEHYNENCAWVDGKIQLFPAAHFSFDRERLLDPWSVKTTGGELDVSFKPAGERKGRVNLGVVMSDFHQPYGLFDGKMSGPGGEKIEIKDKFGVCEYHLARW